MTHVKAGVGCKRRGVVYVNECIAERVVLVALSAALPPVCVCNVCVCVMCVCV